MASLTGLALILGLTFSWQNQKLKQEARYLHGKIQAFEILAARQGQTYLQAMITGPSRDKILSHQPSRVPHLRQDSPRPPLRGMLLLQAKASQQASSSDRASAQ